MLYRFRFSTPHGGLVDEDLEALVAAPLTLRRVALAELTGYAFSYPNGRLIIG